MRYIHLMIIFLATLCMKLNGTETQKYFCVFQSRNSDKQGFFSVFKEILYGLHAYEKGFFAGFSVKCGTNSLYYDPKLGLNFWEYYFEPIDTGDQNVLHKTYISIPIFDLKFNDVQNETHEVIKRHVRLKPHMQAKIDDFIVENFQNFFLIGVHFRGTDKKLEAGRVKYETMIQQIQKQIDTFAHPSRQIKVFVATDEQAFIDFAQVAFPGKICYIKTATRSLSEDAPIHMNPSRDPYKIGEDAVLDCILLSKTNFLIATVSHLNDCSIFFNPKLPRLTVGSN